MDLVIDTSTRYASVAISTEGQIVAELSWRSEQNHSVELVPAIQMITRKANTQIDSIAAVIVSKGPGGFSALRVGISMAKTFAIARKVPIIGVNSLDVEAGPYLGLGLPVCAIIGAGRSKVYTGQYGSEVDDNHVHNPEYIVQSHEELATSFERKTLLCGEGITDVAKLVGERAGDLVTLANITRPTRRPGVIAKLGFEILQGGHTDPPETIEPIYMRAAQIAAAQRNRRNC